MSARGNEPLQLFCPVLHDDDLILANLGGVTRDRFEHEQALAVARDVPLRADSYAPIRAPGERAISWGFYGMEEVTQPD